MLFLSTLAGAGCDSDEPGTRVGDGGSIANGGAGGIAAGGEGGGGSGGDDGGGGGTGGEAEGGSGGDAEGGSGGQAEGGSGGEAKAVCGDGIVEGDEECDDGEENSDFAPNACRSDCIKPFCGDGIHDDEDEGCDAGDEMEEAPNVCRPGCVAPRCGDGIFDDLTEACDTGDELAFAPDACRPGCILPACGDGIRDSGETCDPGIPADEAAGCRSDCTFCGDGIRDEGEACDGGDVPASCVDRGWLGGTMSCGAGCELDESRCHGPEICDNGVDDDQDGQADCDDPDCKSDVDLCPICGDGVRTGSEVCDGGDLGSATCIDAGFPLGGDLSCSAECALVTEGCYQLERCDNEIDDDGDGAIDCDDAECISDLEACPVCGDGFQSGDEECDDGDLDDGDGCSSTCTLEQNVCTLSPDLDVVGTKNGNIISVAGTTVGRPDEMAPACMPSHGSDVVYQFTLPYDADVFAKVGPTGATGTFALEMRDDCVSGTPGLACNFEMGVGEEGSYLDVIEIPAGTRLYFIVDSPPGQEGAYDLSVGTTEILQPGDTCIRFGSENRCLAPTSCQKKPGSSPAEYICM